MVVASHAMPSPEAAVGGQVGIVAVDTFMGEIFTAAMRLMTLVMASHEIPSPVVAGRRGREPLIFLLWIHK